MHTCVLTSAFLSSHRCFVSNLLKLFTVLFLYSFAANIAQKSFSSIICNSAAYTNLNFKLKFDGIFAQIQSFTTVFDLPVTNTYNKSNKLAVLSKLASYIIHIKRLETLTRISGPKVTDIGPYVLKLSALPAMRNRAMKLSCVRPPVCLSERPSHPTVARFSCGFAAASPAGRRH